MARPQRIKFERPAAYAQGLDYGFVRLPLRGRLDFGTVGRLSCTALVMCGANEFLGTHFLDGLEDDQVNIVRHVFREDRSRKFGLLVASMSLDDPKLQRLSNVVAEHAGGRVPDVISIPIQPGMDVSRWYGEYVGQLLCHSEVSAGERAYHVAVPGTEYERSGTADQLAYADPVTNICVVS